MHKKRSWSYFKVDFIDFWSTYSYLIDCRLEGSNRPSFYIYVKTKIVASSAKNSSAGVCEPDRVDYCFCGRPSVQWPGCGHLSHPITLSPVCATQMPRVSRDTFGVPLTPAAVALLSFNTLPSHCLSSSMSLVSSLHRLNVLCIFSIGRQGRYRWP